MWYNGSFADNSHFKMFKTIFVCFPMCVSSQIHYYIFVMNIFDKCQSISKLYWFDFSTSMVLPTFILLFLLSDCKFWQKRHGVSHDCKRNCDNLAYFVITACIWLYNENVCYRMYENYVLHNTLCAVFFTNVLTNLGGKTMFIINSMCFPKISTFL